MCKQTGDGLKPAAFTYHRAATIEHTLDLLAQFAPDGGRVLAGGQSLVPLMALRLAQPAHLIDINRVDFGTLHVDDSVLRIPATARHGDLGAVPGELGRILAVVAGHIAHLPIRSRGTFCGSLAHADPSAEWPLVFATLGGEAVLRSVAGERRVAADAFVLDIMTTALAEDELLTEIRLPIPPPTVRMGFHEVSRRAGDYAMAMAFVALTLDGGTVVQASVGIGGAERRPRRIPAAEAALIGASWTDAAIAQAADAAAAAIDPMQDQQVNAPLRRDLVRTVVRRALRSAAP